MINKNCFFGNKYYRGAYSKPHRQSQEAKAAFDRNDTTYIDWEQRLQIGRAGIYPKPRSLLERALRACFEGNMEMWWLK